MNQTNIFDGNFMKGTRKQEKINLRLCHQLLLYNYDGTQYQEKNSKYSIFNMGEQVISGYRAYKHKRTIIPVYDYSIIFPMIIFGNKINFMSGYPSEILNDNIKRSEGLLYRFISPAISSDLSTSIIITDIQKMEGIIRSVENFVEKFFEFELLDMKDIPTTLNVH